MRDEDRTLALDLIQGAALGVGPVKAKAILRNLRTEFLIVRKPPVDDLLNFALRRLQADQ